MKMKVFWSLLFCVVVCVIPALAQLDSGSIIIIPQNLTVSDAVLKVATWVMAVLIFITTRYSDKIPFLKKIESKWFAALSVMAAIGFSFYKLGLSDGFQAVLAFVGSSAFHEFLKLFTKKQVVSADKEVVQIVQNVSADELAEPEQPKTKKVGRPRKKA